MQRSIEKHKGKLVLCETKRGFKDNIEVDITEIGCGEFQVEWMKCGVDNYSFQFHKR